ncbi:MAG: transposase [Solirubrobacterales bacterium]|nr:transposase [Solirubrobacterales bacterium]
MGTEGTFRSIYRARQRVEAEVRLATFLSAVDRAQLRPFDAFTKRIAQWHSELLADFDEPTTNVYAEGVVNELKAIKRRACGLSTFHGCRKRVVIACGCPDTRRHLAQTTRTQNPTSEGGQFPTGADTVDQFEADRQRRGQGLYVPAGNSEAPFFSPPFPPCRAPHAFTVVSKGVR